jgi:hypothetical protein
VNQKLSAVRKLAAEAAYNGLLDPAAAQAIRDIRGAKLDQIQLSLSQSSIQTTERYLGAQQDVTDAPCGSASEGRMMPIRVGRNIRPSRRAPGRLIAASVQTASPACHGGFSRVQCEPVPAARPTRVDIQAKLRIKRNDILRISRLCNGSARHVIGSAAVPHSSRRMTGVRVPSQRYS